MKEQLSMKRNQLICLCKNLAEQMHVLRSKLTEESEEEKKIAHTKLQNPKLR